MTGVPCGGVYIDRTKKEMRKKNFVLRLPEKESWVQHPLLKAARVSSAVPGPSHRRFKILTSHIMFVLFQRDTTWIRATCMSCKKEYMYVAVEVAKVVVRAALTCDSLSLTLTQSRHAADRS